MASTYINTISLQLVAKLFIYYLCPKIIVEKQRK